MDTNDKVRVQFHQLDESKVFSEIYLAQSSGSIWEDMRLPKHMYHHQSSSTCNKLYHGVQTLLCFKYFTFYRLQHLPRSLAAGRGYNSQNPRKVVYSCREWQQFHSYYLTMPTAVLFLSGCHAYQEQHPVHRKKHHTIQSNSLSLTPCVVICI